MADENRDDLRTRIAATLIDYWPAPWYGSQRQRDQANDLADAVIRELGLKRADGPLKGTPVHRFITDWIPNNE